MRVIALYGPEDSGKSAVLNDLSNRYLHNVNSFRSSSASFCGTVGAYGALSSIMKPCIV